MGLISVMNKFLSLGRFKLREGTQIKLWEDIWLSNQTLKSQYSSLYNIAHRRYIGVADVF
jgi:hypothetical protein